MLYFHYPGPTGGIGGKPNFFFITSFSKADIFFRLVPNSRAQEKYRQSKTVTILSQIMHRQQIIE